MVSTSSLVVGAAAEASRGSLLVAGVAGLLAGAMSMAAGEYVSLSSQADTEMADLDRERCSPGARAYCDLGCFCDRCLERSSRTMTHPFPFAVRKP
jgi:vacuolar iron transporter family protein